jgi:hypothetical protein
MGHGLEAHATVRGAVRTRRLNGIPACENTCLYTLRR